MIIEEAYEGQRGQVRFEPGDAIKLVWYGHGSNLHTIRDAWIQLGAMANMKFMLQFVTNATLQDLESVLKGLPKPVADMEVWLAAWSLENQETFVEWADIVLLPSVDLPEKQVKGHNRLVQAIHAGRLALAFPLAPYKELSQFCWLGENFAEGLKWSLKNPQEVRDRLTQGQAYIDQRFSPEALAKKWTEVVAKLLGQA